MLDVRVRIDVRRNLELDVALFQRQNHGLGSVDGFFNRNLRRGTPNGVRLEGKLTVRTVDSTT